MVRVYCERTTPRIEYIFHFVLEVLCGFEYTIVTNEYDYLSFGGATLNYSSKSLKQNDIEIRPNGLLLLQTISSCEAVVRQEGNSIGFFLRGPGLNENCFDPFAASFYLLTRYEEYLDYVPDMYDRYEAAASSLHKYKLLNRPLVNEWAETLKKNIVNLYPETPFRKNPFQYKLSIDVDQAFAFRHRGAFRNFLSLSKNITHLNGLFLQGQLKTFFSKHDVFDTFDYLRTVQQHFAVPFVYFINVGAYSKYDKNVSTTNQAFQKLLKKIKTYAEIGLHPSYFSNRLPHKFKEEKDALEQVLQQPITKSRQHYLKLTFPGTYRNLLAIGITEDYSMGYASHPGFRAGTCSAFRWFDLEENRCTPLTVFPAVYMENTFAENFQFTPEQAFQYMKELTDTVRLYNGYHISIWHNHSVNDQLLWKGWKTIFEKSIAYLKNTAC